MFRDIRDMRCVVVDVVVRASESVSVCVCASASQSLSASACARARVCACTCARARACVRASVPMRLLVSAIASPVGDRAEVIGGATRRR